MAESKNPNKKIDDVGSKFISDNANFILMSGESKWLNI